MMTNVQMPGALAPMLSGAPPKPGVYLATGPNLLPSWFQRAMLPALALGSSLFWIDGADPFDASGSSYCARSQGVDPRAVLGRVRLARAFNLWQIENIVCRTLPRLWTGQSIVLSDPLSLFYDEGVPFPEVRSVLRRVVDGMKALPAVWLVLSVDKPAPRGRESLLDELLEAAEAPTRLAAMGNSWMLEKAAR